MSVLQCLLNANCCIFQIIICTKDIYSFQNHSSKRSTGPSSPFGKAPVVFYPSIFPMLVQHVHTISVFLYNSVQYFLPYSAFYISIFAFILRYYAASSIFRSQIFYSYFLLPSSQLCRSPSNYCVANDFFFFKLSD